VGRGDAAESDRTISERGPDVVAMPLSSQAPASVADKRVLAAAAKIKADAKKAKKK
jgi:hypothetical protein